MSAFRAFVTCARRAIACRSLALGQANRVILSNNRLAAAPVWQDVRGMAKKPVTKEKKGKTKPKVILRDDELAEVIDIEELRSTLRELVDKLKHDYVTTLNVRSGVGVESLEVEFEEQVYPLRELATITKKGGNLLVLNFSSLPDAIKAAEDAIVKSGMNLNPQQEGTILYLALPKVTREHRESLAKSAKMLFMKSREDFSKVLAAFTKQAKNKSAAGVSEDLIFNTCENVKYLIDSSIHECEILLQTKTKELLGE